MLAASGLCLLGYAIWRQWPEVAAQIGKFGLIDGGLALALAVAMLASSSVVFGLLVDSKGRSARLVLSAASFYLISQAIKYVPGRIWGLFYQVERLRQAVGIRQAASASITHLVIGFLSSLFVLGVAIGSPIFLPLAGFVLLGVWVFRGGAGAYVGRRASASPSAGRLVLVVLGVAVEWFCYLASVAMLCIALGSGERWLMMGALYAVAWLLGSLAVLVPGGIGIREGGFVALGPVAGVPTEDMVSFALVARFVFSGAELLTAGISAVALARRVPPPLTAENE
jgi:hypothetical protein